MKSIEILILFLFSTLSYSQYNEYKDYYPLKVGNQWIMLVQTDIASWNYEYFISAEKDTLINNQTYFKIVKEYPADNSKIIFFEKIDTLTCQVLRFNEYYSCDYIIDSLKADEGDSFKAARYNPLNPFTGLTTCYLVRIDTILGVPTITKAFQGISQEVSQPAYVLAKGFGLVKILGFGYTEQLVYAKINEVIYGIPVANIDEENINPVEYSLRQNFPNPFTPSTTIQFVVPTPPALAKANSPLLKGRNEVGFVTLKVYDILGREVITLVNEVKGSGTYSVSFSPDEKLPSGVYFYRLETENYKAARKMVLVR